MNVMTLGQIADIVTRRHQHTTSPSFRDLAKHEIRLAEDELIDSADWPQLRRSDEIGLRKGDDAALSAVEGGGRFTPAPMDISRVISLDLYSPSRRHITFVDLSELYQSLGSTLALAGPPNCAAFSGMTAQYRELAAESIVTFKTAQAANDNKTIKVAYRRTNTMLGEEAPYQDVFGDFSGAGVPTALAVPAGWSVVAIQIPSDWVGDLTAEDDQAVEIININSPEIPDTNQHNYWRHFSQQLIRFDRVPDVDYQGVFVYQRRPRPMINESDTPEIPIANVLVEKATAALWRAEGEFSKANEHERQAEKYLARVLHNNPREHKQSPPVYGGVTLSTGMGRSGGGGRYW